MIVDFGLDLDYDKNVALFKNFFLDSYIIIKLIVLKVDS